MTDLSEMDALLALERPTGEQLGRAVRLAAAAQGVALMTFCRAIASSGKWLTQLECAARPRAAMVERVRALCRGLPVPPPPSRNRVSHLLIEQHRDCSRPDRARAEPEAVEARREADRDATTRARELREQVARECEQRARVRWGAGTVSGTGPVVPIESVRERSVNETLDALSLGDRVSAAMIESRVDAMQTVARAWPDLWARLIRAARTARVRPATMMMQMIKKGLDMTTEQERAA